jgi:pentatricopeptide repeat protein
MFFFVQESANVSIVSGIKFTDQSDRDFDYKELVAEIRGKAAVGHWKAATRKLKKLRRAFPTNAIPDDVYLATLRACAADRLNGARAAIPARKIIEEMVDVGYSIPADVSNYCIQNCLGEGPNGTHDGFGGIDTALAMLAAVESSSPTTTDGKKDGVLTIDTYSKLVAAMAENGEIDESLALLRSMVVDHSFTPTLEVFAQVAQTAAAQTQAEKAIAVLAYVKAAGYELDNIASTQDGRTILASGVIAAEKLDNLGLGLRLLTAASKASGCAPDRGDDLVASSSAAAQRASTLLHKRAIIAAVNDEGKWKLAVRLLETMMERSLKPSPWVWRNVVTCCAKAEKSRKATALLLDWVRPTTVK